jgi:hypothetical protein
LLVLFPTGYFGADRLGVPLIVVVPMVRPSWALRHVPRLSGRTKRVVAFGELDERPLRSEVRSPDLRNV